MASLCESQEGIGDHGDCLMDQEVPDSQRPCPWDRHRLEMGAKVIRDLLPMGQWDPSYATQRHPQVARVPKAILKSCFDAMRDIATNIEHAGTLLVMLLQFGSKCPCIIALLHRIPVLRVHTPLGIGCKEVWPLKKKLTISALFSPEVC